MLSDAWEDYRDMNRAVWNGCQWPFGKLLIFPLFFVLWTGAVGLTAIVRDIPLEISEWLVSSGTWERYFWKSEEEIR